MGEGGKRAGTTGPWPIKGTRKCIRRPVNWENVKEETQEKEKRWLLNLQTPMPQQLEVTFRVFNNRDQTEEEEKTVMSRGRLELKLN